MDNYEELALIEQEVSALGCSGFVIVCVHVITCLELVWGNNFFLQNLAIWLILW